MFENKKFEGIYYSRFIASWMNARGGKIDWMFKSWLTTLTINGKKIPNDIIREMYELGSNGKLELETSAKNYVNNPPSSGRYPL